MNTTQYKVPGLLLVAVSADSLLTVFPLFFLTALLNQANLPAWWELLLLLACFMLPFTALYLLVFTWQGRRRRGPSGGSLLQGIMDYYNQGGPRYLVLCLKIFILALFLLNMFLFGRSLAAKDIILAAVLVVNNLVFLYYLLKWPGKHRGPSSSRLVFLILPLMLLFFFLSPAPEPTAVEAPPAAAGTPRHKLVVLGIDGLNDRVLAPFCRENPFSLFARCQEQGIYAPMGTLFPTASPVIWTTIASGYGPRVHGIIGFGRFRWFGMGQGFSRLPKFCGLSKAVFVLKRLGIMTFQPNLSSHVRCPRWWDILSHYGLPILVLHYPVTLPPAQVQGTMVPETEFVAHFTSMDQVPVWPAEAGQTIALFAGQAKKKADILFQSRLLPLLKDKPEQVRDLARTFFTHDFIALYTYQQCLLHAMGSPVMDVLYFHGFDGSCHLFLQDFLQAVNRGQQAGATYLGAYLDFIDTFLQDITAAMAEPANLLILSDHGFTPANLLYRIQDPTRGYLQGVHEYAPDAVLIAHGPSVNRDAALANVTIFDVTPTVLHYLGLPTARDFSGRVQPIFDPRPALETASYLGLKLPLYTADPKRTDSKGAENMLKSLGYIN